MGQPGTRPLLSSAAPSPGMGFLGPAHRLHPRESCKKILICLMTKSLKFQKEASSRMSKALGPGFDSDQSFGNTARYFTLVIVILPSILAVFIPASPDASAANDVALLVTDGLIVLLITWVIRGLTEWPWNWRKDIKDTKFAVMNHANSTMLMSPQSSSLDHDLKLLRQLMWYEKLALFYCFCGVVVGALLMILARNHIIVVESRRAIVFSNLNISIYVMWGLFRVGAVLFEAQKGRSLYHSDEYNLINESNISKYLPQQSSFWLTVLSYFKMSEGQDIDLKLEQTEQRFHQMYDSQHGQIEKLTRLMAHLQHNLLVLNKKNTAPLNDFTPFPLNLGRHTRLKNDLPVAESTFEFNALKTLSHIEEHPEDVLENSFIMSLHGVPPKSLMKSVHGDQNYKDQTNSLVSDVKVEREQDISRVRLILLFLQDLVVLVEKLRKFYPISGIVNDPYLLHTILEKEIKPFIKESTNTHGKDLCLSSWLKHVYSSCSALLLYADMLMSKVTNRVKLMLKLCLRIATSPVRLMIWLPRKLLMYFLKPYIRQPSIPIKPVFKLRTSSSLKSFHLHSSKKHRY